MRSLPFRHDLSRPDDFQQTNASSRSLNRGLRLMKCGLTTGILLFLFPNPGRRFLPSIASWINLCRPWVVVLRLRT